jgi:hypothetical protein
VSEAKDEHDLLMLATNDDERDSNAALWMLLLLRLAAVTTDLRAEVRNGTSSVISQTMWTVFNLQQGLFRRFLGSLMLTEIC